MIRNSLYRVLVTEVHKPGSSNIISSDLCGHKLPLTVCHHHPVISIELFVSNQGIHDDIENINSEIDHNNHDGDHKCGRGQ